MSDYQPSNEKEFYKAPETSKTIYEYLTNGLEFDIPDVPFDKEYLKIPEEVQDAIKKKVPKVELEDLTTREIHGSGVFDGIMEAMEKHLHREYEESRITGTEYAKAYMQALQYSIQNAVTFTLQRDKAYWDAVTARMQVLQNYVNVFTAQVQLAIAKSQVLTNKAQWCALILQLATADAGYKAAQNNLLLQREQILATHEQAESYHAQTQDNRLDGSTPVTGTVDRQKKLHEQQVEAYKRDSELKAAKIWTEAWIAESTVNDEVKLPEAFSNEQLNKVLAVIRKNNHLQE